MDFSLPPEVEANRQTIKRIIRENFRPEMVERQHATGTFDCPEVVEAFAREGIIERAIPGLGKGDPVELWMLFNEMEKAGVPHDAVSIAVMIAGVVNRVGTEDQKARILPGVVAGTSRIAMGYSEPDAGSDVANAATRAVRDGDQWVINGAKMWTTMAHVADWLILLTRTDPDVPKHKGLTMFILPMDTPGITVEPVPTMGTERTNATFYDDVRVGDEAVLGEVNRGWDVMTVALSLERGVMGGTNPGVPLLRHFREWASSTGLLADPLVWERLRRFLRSGRLQIEEPGVSLAPLATMSLAPEPVDVEVKIVLIGSREQYYALQDAAPEFMRHFRAKVDFADSFLARDDTRRASAIFVAHACRQHGLPHFSPAAVARLLEESHREADDQARESAIFAATEALVLESAAICRARGPGLVLAEDVDVALVARAARHDYPEQRLRESIADGDVLIALRGAASGQINALTQIDLGDARFGLPVRVSARTYAGEDGVLNIAREVELSGPVHDKGVFILQSYLAALFGHLAPLSLDASIVFEQQYQGVEGDSASCAEFYALVSALSGVSFSQGIAVTGALNQHGEVLPVGGVNEKIEGWFRVCESAGLDGRQGVLIPARNRRHLMLAPAVVAAVAAGRFHVHTAEHVLDGLALLSGVAAGEADTAGAYPRDSVLGRAEAALGAFREACREQPRAHRPGMRGPHRRERG